MPITNIALGNSKPMNGRVTGPDRFHRIVVNEIIDAIEETAPKSSVEPEVLFGPVRQRSDTGGEDVDVGLDALIGVVDRVVDETCPVVGLAVEPVAGELIGQPRAPAQHESLRQRAGPS